MGRRLIIHIGAPKAGSSALQAFFALNAEHLRHQGIFYPLSPHAANLSRPQSGNGLVFAKALAHAPLAPETRALVRNRLRRPYPAIFLSSEFFWSVGADGWGIVAKECRRFECQVQILAYLRPQTDWLRSIYSQRLRRHGEHRSLRQLYLDTRHKLIPQNALKHVLRFSPDLRLYTAHGLCADAASYLGVSGPLQYEDEPVNSGASREEASTLRARNAALAGATLDDWPADMTPDLHQEMAEFFAPHNEAISAQMNAPLVIPPIGITGMAA